MPKGYSAEAARKAREVSQREKDSLILPPEQQITKILVTLREVIINQNGYEQGTRNYYGFEPKNRVYRFSFLCPYRNRELSDTFRANNRNKAKEVIAAYFNDLYKAYQPKYHN